MALTWLQIKTRLYPWAKVNLTSDNQHLVTDTAVLDICNQVAKDLCRQAELRPERYYKKTVAATTNYTLTGNIFRVLLFRYHASGYADQLYAHVLDRIVLKDTPDADVQLDIRYLRDAAVITDTDTDEVDLPDYALDDFLELVKLKILVDYHPERAVSLNYTSELMQRTTRLEEVKPQRAMDGVETFSHSLGAGDDTQYDITDQRLDESSLVLDTGIYSIVI